MNILVTGGTGFAGSQLSFRLLNEGHKVRILDYQKGLYVDRLIEAGAEIMIGSVTAKSVVDSATEGVDRVFHLAAAFRELDRPDTYYFDVNVNGTRNVMESSKSRGVAKVIHVSTQGVHGHIETPPGDEQSPIAPADYYQETKHLGELVVREFAGQGVKATILRPTAIYGPGDPARFFMIFNHIKKNGSFPMFGTGTTFYHPLYIENFNDACLLGMGLDKGNGEAYLIGDEGYLTIEELVGKVAESMDMPVKIKHLPITPLVIAGHLCEKLCKPFGISPPIFPRRVDWYRQDRAFTIDKARRELSFEPKISTEEGLRLTAQWYFDQGYLSQ